MSEKIVRLNEEVIKGQIKESARGSVEETLNELLEKEGELREKGVPVSLNSLGRKAELLGGLDHAVGVRPLLIRAGNTPDPGDRGLQPVLFGDRRQTRRPAVGDIMLFDAVIFHRFLLFFYIFSASFTRNDAPPVVSGDH